MRYLNSRIRSCYCAPMIWLFAPEGGPPVKAAAYFFGALSELRGVVTNVVRIRDALPDLGYHLPNAIGCVRRIGNRGS